MTSSVLAERVGAQSPRVRRVPEYVSSAGPAHVYLARRAGLFLDPWQCSVLHDGLGRNAAGLPTSRKNSVWVPRQNGKGGIIEALELHWVFVDDEPVVHTAHEQATASKAYQRMEAICRANPFLHSRVRQYRQTNGQQWIELRTGVVLEYRTRSRTGGRGFSTRRLIGDEAQELTADQVAATEPLVSAQGEDWQIWYFGTPPEDPEAWCYGLREDGEAGVDGMAHWDWGADLDLRKPEDRERVHDLDLAYACNPAMGIRIAESTVLGEMRPSGLGEKYPAERLGVWKPRLVRGAAAWKVIGRERWAALLEPGSRIVGPVTYAVSVSMDGKRAAVGVAGARDDGSAHVEVAACTGDGEPGTDDEGADWVVDWLVTRGIKRVVAQEKGVPGIADDLVDAGVEVVWTNTAQLAVAHAKFADACMPTIAALRHLGQPCLDDALGGAATRSIGGGWAWDERGTAEDLTPLKAVTLAHWAHLESTRPGAGAESTYEKQGLLTLG